MGTRQPRSTGCRPVAFEILLALAEGERHGYEVMIEIERRSAGTISPNPGTLYRTLDDSCRKGC